MELDYGSVENPTQLRPLQTSLRNTLNLLNRRAGNPNSGGEVVYMGGSGNAAAPDVVATGVIGLINEYGQPTPEAEEAVIFLSTILGNAATDYLGLDREAAGYEHHLERAMPDLYVPNIGLFNHKVSMTLLGEEKIAEDFPEAGIIGISLTELISGTQTLKDYKLAYHNIYRRMLMNIALLNDPGSNAGWKSTNEFAWGDRGLSFPEGSTGFSRNWKERFNKGGFMLFGYYGQEMAIKGEKIELIFDTLTSEASKYYAISMGWQSKMNMLPDVIRRRLLPGQIFVPPFDINVAGIDKHLAKDLKRYGLLDWKVPGVKLGDTSITGFHNIAMPGMKPVMILPQYVDSPQDVTTAGIFGMVSMINPAFMEQVAGGSHNTGANPEQVAKDLLIAKRAGEPGAVPVKNWELTIRFLGELNDILNGFGSNTQSGLNALALRMREPALRSLLDIHKATQRR